MASTQSSRSSDDVSPRRRVEAVLEGRTPDRVPVSFWLHNFTREATPDLLVEETLRLQRSFAFDIVKPQSPASAAGSAWGAQVSDSARPDEWPQLTRPGVRSADDLVNITPRGVTAQLADQVEVMRRVRAALGPDVPVLGTIFSPLMVLWLMHAGGKPATLEMVREAPAGLTPALDAIAATMCDFATALIEEGGVDGIFYATTTCNRGELTDAEHARYHEPYDRAILGACKAAPMNVLHLCGRDIEARRFADTEARIISWELGFANPGLTEMHDLFGRTMLTGVPGKPDFGTVPVETLVAQVDAAITETGGRHLIVAPGCSVNPGVDEARIAAVVEAARIHHASAAGPGRTH